MAGEGAAAHRESRRGSGGRWLMIVSVGSLGVLGVLYLIMIGPGIVGLAAFVIAGAVALTWTLIPDSATGQSVRRFVAALAQF